MIWYLFCHQNEIICIPDYANSIFVKVNILSRYSFINQIEVDISQ